MKSSRNALKTKGLRPSCAQQGRPRAGSRNALKTKGLRLNSSTASLWITFQKCPENKGIETLFKAPNKRPDRFQKCPENKGIETREGVILAFKGCSRNALKTKGLRRMSAANDFHLPFRSRNALKTKGLRLREMPPRVTH